MSQIQNDLNAVQNRISEAVRRSGRAPESVRLVAVSKTYPFDAVREAWGAGQKAFGESRVQEALAKIPLLPAGLEWHFIGHLQTNKIRKALPLFSLFHGVDNADTARQMDRISAETGTFARVLLEVNVSGERSKYGFSPDALRAEFDSLLALSRLQIAGLMTIAPYADHPGEARPVFSGLRELRDDLQQRGGVLLPELSMGMSGDFEAAIAEGATIVRVGSAIFGERPRKEE